MKFDIGFWPDNSIDMILLMRRDGTRLYASPACPRFWVTNPKKCLPCRREKLHPDDADRVTRIMRSILDGSVDRQSVINRTRHGDQHWVWVEAQFRVLKDPKTGERIGIIGALRDISVRKAVEDKLAEATRS